MTDQVDGAGQIRNWASIFWLRNRGPAQLCPAGVLSVVDGRVRFQVSAAPASGTGVDLLGVDLMSVFDLPLTQATYSVGARLSGNPLIIQATGSGDGGPPGPGLRGRKYVLLGALAHGRPPDRALVTRSAAIRAEEAARLGPGRAGDGYRFPPDSHPTPGPASSMVAWITDLLTAGTTAGVRYELTAGPRQTAALCQVLHNNGVAVDTSRLRR